MPNYTVRYKNGAFYKCKPDWEWKFGPFADSDLWMVASGKGSMRIDGKNIELSSGSAFLLLPGCCGHASHDPDNPLRVFAIHFDFVSSGFVSQKYLHYELEQVEFVTELMKQSIIASGNGNREDAEFWLEAAIRKTIDSKSRNTPRNHLSQINELCAQIISDPKQRHAVRKMAATLHLDKDHFTRIFKNIRGLSPGEFVIRNRIKYACSLLLDSNMTVNEIADELGYDNVYFFSRQFKLKTGKSPSAYRRKN